MAKRKKIAGMPNGNTLREVRQRRKKQARKKRSHREELTRTRNGEVQTRAVTRDPDAHARHEEWGRRPSQRRPGEWTEYRERALAELHSRTLECKGCGLPVDWITARKRAAERMPSTIEISDGCIGQKCGKRNKNQTMAVLRRKMARRCAELRAGVRRLVEWPEGPDDTEAWVRPADAVERMLAHVQREIRIE